MRRAYDGGAGRRDGSGKQPWKLAERAAFLERVREDGGRRLLEVGAGTGQDSAYFLANGLDVVAVDLSPEMVERCREKGVDAHVMDFLHLDFAPGSFDAVYAMNCLLHVPDEDLPAVLDAIRTLLRPGGLLYVGVYGGGTLRGEGPYDGDDHDPPRFFSFRTDEELQAFTSGSFRTVDFHVVGVDALRFQSLTLRGWAPSERAG
ncbi:class I SAM-dependent methyltransferase [Nonomuraea soli]|uniref:SAM-dependent methyltransferase n=1 Tax=Nonomuraea soli TaxID=1032476 RepID=A0A7W0HQL1_9ACTN|nr:class I SAM-dependent methyltransferase [Nonomuraea soli]MBA2891746.1 SAM-dependent methyltransferase [Nonomuraea soli]